MDPQACFERLIKAGYNHEHDEVIAAAGDLLAWTLGGGFLPKTTATERDLMKTYIAKAADVLDDANQDILDRTER